MTLRFPAATLFLLVLDFVVPDTTSSFFSSFLVNGLRRLGFATFILGPARQLLGWGGSFRGGADDADADADLFADDFADALGFLTFRTFPETNVGSGWGLEMAVAGDMAALLLPLPRLLAAFLVSVRVAGLLRLF